jgi:shikimate kinase
MNIVLIGYRCSGKTSVGREVAARLGMAFYDTDALIQEENNRTIQEIVADGGWPAFRAEEKKVIARLALQDRCVIALGGGSVLDRENIEVMRVNGLIVWLKADIQTILDRMGNDAVTAAQRPPLLGQDSIRETTLVLEQRTPIYDAAADLTIDTKDGNPDEISGEIIKYFTEGV